VWKSFIAGRANVLAILKSRIFLGLIGLALLAVLLWFAGPYFAFADHKPLEGVVGRLIAILVLVAIWAIVMTLTRLREGVQRVAAALR
jgi:type VI secretion system protein ImpL